MKTVIVTVVALLVSVVALSWRVLFVKGGKFPDGHIGHSKAMADRGIRCAHSDDGNATKK